MLNALESLPPRCPGQTVSCFTLNGCFMAVQGDGGTRAAAGGRRLEKRQVHRQVLPTSLLLTLVTGPRRSLSLTLSDTRVYEPQVRARLGNNNTFL